MVYLTNICNLSCGHCIMKDMRRGNEELSATSLDMLVADCVRFNIPLVNIAGGGEPLCNSHYFPFIQKLHDVGIKVGLNTNGILLPSTLPVDYLRISVDAATKETYAKVKGVDRWDTLNKNLKEFKKQGELGLAYLVTHENAHEVEMFCQWAQQFDYDFIHIRPAYWPEHDEAIKAACLSIDVEKLCSEYRNVNIRFDKFRSTWDGNTFSKCRATCLKAVLCADGSFVPCQDVFTKFGNYNTQTFEEAWFSPEHRNVIESIDLKSCPRCVEGPTNEIIEHCVMGDQLRIDIF
jgi:MoaA/NifB/PqqE/SkfB family radical SAM enzyme